MVVGCLSTEDYKRLQSVSAPQLGDKSPSYSRWLLNSLVRCYDRLTDLYSLLATVNVINFKLKTWFGIWNLGLESEICW